MKLTAILLLAAHSAAGWNAAGHRTSAYIAFQSLTAAEQRKVAALLKDHPEFAGFDGVETLLKASVWPDEIRGDKRFYDESRPGVKKLAPYDPRLPDAAVHARWHYVNQPLVGEGLNGLKVGPGTAFRDGQTVLERIVTLQKEMADSRFRAYRLSWLTHLIGDLHMPLHAVAHITAASPRGDLGGNLFKIEPFSNNVMKRPLDNLHSFWDAALGQDDATAAVSALGDRLLKQHPRPSAAVLADVETWFNESATIGRRFVYPKLAGAVKGPGGLPTVTEKYFREANKISGKRAAYAGYRLAAVLGKLVAQ